MASLRITVVAGGAVALLIGFIIGVANDVRVSATLSALLFNRPGTQPCVPDLELGRGPAPALRAMSEAEVAVFERDGSVILRGVLPDVWVQRLRLLAQDVFEHPNVWDVLYSRLVANFYCAQKSLLVHHTSKCGQQIAEASPTTTIAAGLLRTSTLQVCEPNIALGNFRSPKLPGLVEDCGTTGYHTDDAYMPVSRRDPHRAAMVRLWIPLTSFHDDQFTFSTLNNSETWLAQRAAVGASLNGILYRKHEVLEQSGILALDGHVISPGRHGLKPGDVFAYAGETPHFAKARNCSLADGCLRLILSYAGDNAVYTSGKQAALIPLHDNQTSGTRPYGVQFPTIWASPSSAFSNDAFKSGRWEWSSPFQATLGTTLRSLWHAAIVGSGAYAGKPWLLLQYSVRVALFTVNNFWDVPQGDGSPSKPFSLTAHFCTSWLRMSP